ncbi:unnamed protein product [Cunninghamella blakesleeana]
MGLNKKGDTNIDNKQYEWERLFEPQCSFSSISYNKKLENNLKTLSKRKPIYYQHHRQPPTHYNGTIRHLPNLGDIKEENEEVDKQLNNHYQSNDGKQKKKTHLETLKEPNKEINQEVNRIGKTTETVAITEKDSNNNNNNNNNTAEKVPIILPNSSKSSLHESILPSSSVISLPGTSPTLPKLEQLFLRSLPDQHIDQHQVLILPCPSLSLMEMEQEKEYNKMKMDEQYHRKERLKILSRIHYDDHFNEDHKNNPPINKWSKDAEEERVAHPFLEQRKIKEWYLLGWYETKKKIVQRFSSKKIATDSNHFISQKNQYPPPHLSFICFLIGFLFPPFWIFWPTLMKHHYKKRNYSMSSMDFKWKSRSRFAFYLFLISILVVFIVLLLFYPRLLGYR